MESADTNPELTRDRAPGSAGSAKRGYPCGVHNKPGAAPASCPSASRSAGQPAPAPGSEPVTELTGKPVAIYGRVSTEVQDVGNLTQRASASIARSMHVVCLHGVLQPDMRLNPQSGTILPIAPGGVGTGIAACRAGDSTAKCSLQFPFPGTNTSKAPFATSASSLRKLSRALHKALSSMTPSCVTSFSIPSCRS